MFSMDILRIVLGPVNSPAENHLKIFQQKGNRGCHQSLRRWVLLIGIREELLEICSTICKTGFPSHGSAPSLSSIYCLKHFIYRAKLCSIKLYLGAIFFSDGCHEFMFLQRIIVINGTIYRVQSRPALVRNSKYLGFTSRCPNLISLTAVWRRRPI